jgi:hypothetical protein
VKFVVNGYGAVDPWFRSGSGLRTADTRKMAKVDRKMVQA